MDEPREEEINQEEENTTMEGLARGIARMLEESDEIEEESQETSFADISAKLNVDDEGNEAELDSDNAEIKQNNDDIQDSVEDQETQEIEETEESEQEEQTVESADAEETEETEETEGEKLDLQPIVESILFVNEKPISASEIAKPLELDRAEVEATLKRLQEIYEGRNGGLRIFKVSGGYQMRTCSESVDWVKKLYRNKFKRRLSNSALEVLSIVAYKQPITKMELEAIRGVDCDGVIRSLSNIGLVKIKGRKDVIGRPFLYGTSDAFLEHFGLNSLRDMPKIDFEESAIALSKLEEEQGEQTESTEITEATVAASVASQPEESQMEINEEEYQSVDNKREAIDVEAVAVEVQEEQENGS